MTDSTQKKNPEFATHKLNEIGFQKAEKIRDSFDTLVNDLESVCQSGRYLAIVKTKLEEACFFAKKAMATDLNNQAAEAPTDTKA